MYDVYISSSWKNREKVREIAQFLEKNGLKVFDFTNSKNRTYKEVPPETVPDFDPDQHNYFEYLFKTPYVAAVEENYRAIQDSKVILLLLPCGCDAHADWALGVGMGKPTIILGHPNKGERMPVHIWADEFLDTTEGLITSIKKLIELKYSFIYKLNNL